MEECAKTDAPLFDVAVKRFGADGLLAGTINGRLSWNYPHNAELVKNNAAYRAVFEKYRK